MNKRRRQGKLRKLTPEEQAKRAGHYQRTKRAQKSAAKIKRVPGESEE